MKPFMSVLHQSVTEMKQSPHEQGKTNQQQKDIQVSHSLPLISITLPPRRLNWQQETHQKRQE
jgi:hypothetical protein